MSESKVTTEYLIMHEDEIDWDELSKDTFRSFSLPEIRLFRKKINWARYLTNHSLSTNELIIASKYFSQNDYNILALFNNATEEFIEMNKDKFNWEIVVKNCYLSEETFNKCFEYWSNIPKKKLEELFTENKSIDIYDGNYDSILLYLSLKKF